MVANNSAPGEAHGNHGGRCPRMEKYEAPELCKNENLKELTKFDSIVSMIDGSMPSEPTMPSGPS